MMKLPAWLKPGIWGGVVGAIAMAIVGFSQMGWTTKSNAERMAREGADSAVVAALVPFCVAKAQQDTDGAKLVTFRAETSSYSRSELVKTNGWATLAGMPSPDYALTQACSDKLQIARAN
jgi:hypothetical protein